MEAEAKRRGRRRGRRRRPRPRCGPRLRPRRFGLLCTPCRRLDCTALRSRAATATASRPTVRNLESEIFTPLTLAAATLAAARQVCRTAAAERGADFRFQISRLTPPLPLEALVYTATLLSTHHTRFVSARKARVVVITIKSRRVRFISFTFQKAQFRCHTSRNIGIVCPRRKPEKTRSDTKEKPAITTTPHAGTFSGGEPWVALSTSVSAHMSFAEGSVQFDGSYAGIACGWYHRTSIRALT